jgi:hypothetical protein
MFTIVFFLFTVNKSLANVRSVIFMHTFSICIPDGVFYHLFLNCAGCDRIEVDYRTGRRFTCSFKGVLGLCRLSIAPVCGKLAPLSHIHSNTPSPEHPPVHDSSLDFAFIATSLCKGLYSPWVCVSPPGGLYWPFFVPPVWLRAHLMSDPGVRVPPPSSPLTDVGQTLRPNFKSTASLCLYQADIHGCWLAESVFLNLLRSPGIDFQHGGPVRQPYVSYRPARLHRLAESISRNRFLGIDSWAP